MKGLEAAFVTGATGLLGNNLVRELAGRRVRVKALARSRAKAALQFGDLPGVEIVEGDMLSVAGFAAALSGADVLFHTAAHFRDSYTGGDHWDELRATNIDGTRNLLTAAYDAGVRRAVVTSSIAVLDGPRGAVINETMVRGVEKADDYYKSKILADEVAFELMKAHPDLDVTFYGMTEFRFNDPDGNRLWIGQITPPIS